MTVEKDWDPDSGWRGGYSEKVGGVARVEVWVSGKRVFLALQHELGTRNGDPGLWNVSLGQGPWYQESLQRESGKTQSCLAISPGYSHIPMWCDYLALFHGGENSEGIRNIKKPRDIK